MGINPGALNPNIPSQLAGLTAGQLSNILSNFNGKQVSVWDIEEASYISFASKNTPGTHQPVPFHVFKSSVTYKAGLTQVTDTYGRRKVKYLFPYKDGQTSDDLGKKPAEYTFDVLIHGPNYLAGFQALVDELAQDTPGTLTHPVLGDVDVIVDDYTVVHDSATRMAVHVSLKFSEHSFTIQDTFDISASNNKSFTSKLSKVLDAFNKFTTLANKVSANLAAFSTLRQQVTQGVSNFSSYFSQVCGQINAAFNSNPSSIPSLFPVNSGGIQSANGTISNPPVVSGLSPNDPFANIPLNQLSASAQQAIAAQAISASVQTAWNQGAALIRQLEATPNGALVFHDNILDIKNSLLDMQSALQAGLASAKFRLFKYTTPRDMSVREVAFANQVSLDKVAEIAVLNPSLDSVNNIPKGTIVTVAV
jgi:DNA circularisation protein N-terminus